MLLHTTLVTAWTNSSVDSEWKIAEGIYILKEKESKCLNQFRPISLLNGEGKIYLSCLAIRLTHFMTESMYIDTSVQNGVPGCIIQYTPLVPHGFQICEIMKILPNHGESSQGHTSLEMYFTVGDQHILKSW